MFTASCGANEILRFAQDDTGHVIALRNLGAALVHRGRPSTGPAAS